MAILSRYVAGQWQVVATAPPANTQGQYNPNASLPLASVEAMLAMAVVSAQTIMGRTDKTGKKTVYAGTQGRYSAVAGDFSQTITNTTSGVTTNITPLLAAAVSGSVTVVGMVFTEGPVIPPFWTAHRKTSEVI